jgi:hypothetical protein
MLVILCYATFHNALDSLAPTVASLIQSMRMSEISAHQDTNLNNERRLRRKFYLRMADYIVGWYNSYRGVFLAQSLAQTFRLLFGEQKSMTIAPYEPLLYLALICLSHELLL